ncbi:MAG: hydroxymyristoyl-ACP dehydratase [Bacteroidetes bacterium]|jgi:3-hydroxyacyl-[acyl-carrier-protein] dehydratase|nr:hydroxymyristoyl-ACP dehydratase [Bacteroidota bacterium]
MDWKEEIVGRLPYGQGFLFVDSLDTITDESIEGSYTFKKDLFFYDHHFPGNPVTPGVILIECMAQIGLVCFGIYLERDNVSDKGTTVLLTDTNVNFKKIVPRGTIVKVVAKKIYYRMGKLKVNVKMVDNDGSVLARGEIAGMVKRGRHGK